MAEPVPSLGPTGLDSYYTRVPPGWGQKWRAARSAAGSRLVKVGVIGDSISIGWCSTQPASWLTTGYVGLIRQVLQANYGNGGSGFVSVDYVKNTGNNAIGSGWLGSVSGSSDWSRFPDGNGNNSHGGVNWCAVQNAAASATISIPLTGNNAASVFARNDPTFGTYTWNINGGTTSSVTCNAAASINPKASALSGMTAGSWTLNLGIGTGTVELYGAAAYNSTGIAIDNLSMSGRTCAHLLTATAGSGNNPSGDTTSMLGPWDLVIYVLSVNDMTQSSFASVGANLASSWSAIKQASTNSTAPSDTIFVISNWGTGPNPFQDAIQHAQASMAQQIYTLANSLGAAVIDLWSYAGRSAEPWNTNGWQPTGNVHPTSVGHTQYQAAIQPLLLS